MDRDLCINCDHFREAHYHPVTGAWQGDLLGCSEYQGSVPDEDRAAGKADELRKVRARIQELRAEKRAAFIDG